MSASTFASSTCLCAAALRRSSKRSFGKPQRSLRPSLRGPLRVHAKSKAEETLEGVVENGNKILDSVVDLVPESVPRPTARIATGVVGVALVFWIFQKILSTLLFFLVVGGGAYLFLQSQSKPISGNTETDRDDDDDDPMSMARKIMDKYD